MRTTAGSRPPARPRRGWRSARAARRAGRSRAAGDARLPRAVAGQRGRRLGRDWPRSRAASRRPACASRPSSAGTATPSRPPSRSAASTTRGRSTASARCAAAVGADDGGAWARAVAATAGRYDGASRAAPRAERRALGEPFEHARTLLVLGAGERRDRQRRRARGALEEALATLRGARAPLWAERARAELARVGGRRRRRRADADRARVAELIAAGRTYREAADELFISPKTVQWNLSKVYRKLGIRSRAELPAGSKSSHPAGFARKPPAVASVACTRPSPSSRPVTSATRRGWEEPLRVVVAADTVLVARGARPAARPPPATRSSPRPATATTSCARSAPIGPTWPSSTSACRPTHTDEGLQQRRRSAPSCRRSASSCSPPISRSVRARAAGRRRRGLGYLLKDRIAEIERFVDARPARRARRLGARPRGRGRRWSAAATTRSRPSPRASASARPGGRAQGPRIAAALHLSTGPSSATSTAIFASSACCRPRTPPVASSADSSRRLRARPDDLVQDRPVSPQAPSSSGFLEPRLGVGAPRA